MVKERKEPVERPTCADKFHLYNVFGNHDEFHYGYKCNGHRG